MTEILQVIKSKIERFGNKSQMFKGEEVALIITTIESLQTEYADERTAHNFHVTELLQKDALIESQKEEIERAWQAVKHWQDRYDGTSPEIESLQKENRLQHEAISEAIAKWETMLMEDDPANVMESILATLYIGKSYSSLQEGDSK